MVIPLYRYNLIQLHGYIVIQLRFHGYTVTVLQFMAIRLQFYGYTVTVLQLYSYHYAVLWL